VNKSMQRQLVRMAVWAILLNAAVAALAYLLLGSGGPRLAAVLVAMPVAALVAFALISLRALPLPALVLVLIAVAAPVAFYWVDAGLFRQTWLAIAIALAANLVAWFALLLPYANHEVVSELRTLNPEGAAAALVVYHPGRSDLPERIAAAFAAGLASSGWRVDVTTASRQAPTDLSAYQLLVLGAPTYDWAPAGRLVRYLRRLGDLRGKQTALLVTAMGVTQQSLPALERLGRAAHGEVVKALALEMRGQWNPDGPGDPVELARREGAAIALH
jgi:hypothetical protein